MGIDQSSKWYKNEDDKARTDNASGAKQMNKSNFTADLPQSNEKNPIKVTPSKNKSTFRSLSKSSTCGTSRSETKKQDSITIAHKIGFSLSDAKIFDRSKFSICEAQANSDKSAEFVKSESASKLQNSAESIQSAKVKSTSKSVNTKLTKASTSANKLKYPVTQPINKTTKVKGSSINEHCGKIRFKSSKIKSNDLNSQRNN